MENDRDRAEEPHNDNGFGVAVVIILPALFSDIVVEAPVVVIVVVSMARHRSA